MTLVLTKSFVNASLADAVKTENKVSIANFMNGGLDGRMVMYCALREQNQSIFDLMLHQPYHVDPFLQIDDDDYDDDDNDGIVETTAASPFLAAARRSACTNFLQSCLDIWNLRFISTDGLNCNGDYPIHLVCCDPHVSLKAIQLLVRHNPDALAKADGQEGLLPFHFAANWGASLDVIYYLLQHCPDALSHHGNAVAAATRTAALAALSAPAAALAAVPAAPVSTAVAADIGPAGSSSDTLTPAVGTSGSHTTGMDEATGSVKDNQQHQQQNAHGGGGGGGGSGPVPKKAKTTHSGLEPF